MHLGIFTSVAAGLAAFASAERQTRGALREQNARLEAVHRLSVLVRREDDLERVFALVLDTVETVLGASHIAILLADDAGIVRCVAGRGLPPGPDGLPPESPGRATDGVPLLVADVEADDPPGLSAERRAALDQLGVRSVGCFPLIARDMAIGELLVGFDARRVLDPRCVQLAETIAAHLGYAVERQRAHETLGRGEAQLRLALRAAHMGTWQYDPTDQRMYWSPEVEAIHGLEPGSFSGTLSDVLTRVHENDHDRVRQAFASSVTLGTHQVEYRIVRPDGEIRWIAETGRVTSRAARPSQLSGVSMDITDRKEAERQRGRMLAAERAARHAVEQAHERSSFLAQASAVLGASLDRETMLTSIADAIVPHLADWCAVDLLDGDESLRRVSVAHIDPQKVAWANTLHERYPPDPQAPTGVPNVIRTGRSEFYPQISDAQLTAAAQSPEHLQALRSIGFQSAVIVPLVARQKTLGALTLVTAESGRHYTAEDLQLAEELARRAAIAVDNAELFSQLEQAGRAKDEFLATVSHELRTPLNAILGWAHMLRSGTVQPDQRDSALVTIERNAQALTQLVSDVLDVSRIISGRLSRAVDEVDHELEPIVGAAVDALKPVAKAKGVALEYQPSTGLTPAVKGHPPRIRQIVANLVSNAVKFTPQGGRVTVGVARTAAGSVEITVRDTGEGIAPALLPFVFDRFQQGDGSTTRRHGGLGLGLAIVRHLVELHGGTVTAASPGEDQGSTFTVRLPASEPRPAGTAEQHRVDEGHASLVTSDALRGCHVLAVDDNPDARRLLTFVLEASGADARVVSSSDEAVRTLEAWPADIVVLDIGMPREDGYEVLERLLRHPAVADRRPASVALTAHAGPENRARALAAGFDLYVSKPFEPPDLVDALRALWESREVERRAND